jgi:hypothetical protein
MFDKTIVLPGSQHHSHNHSHNVTVHEHRAPTDDSIRLAKEMEEKVKNQILGTAIVNNNSFEIALYKLHHISCHSFRAVWMLNGSKHHIDIEVSMLKTKQEIATAVRDEVAKAIASNMLMQLSIDCLKLLDL